MIVFESTHAGVKKNRLDGGYIMRRVSCVTGSNCHFKVWFDPDGVPIHAQKSTASGWQRAPRHQMDWINRNMRIEAIRHG